MPLEDRTYLGIEAGATHTTVLLAATEQQPLVRFELGPANIRLISDVALLQMFRTMAERVGMPSGIAAGMAGLRTEHDRLRVLNLAAQVWPGVPFQATNDLEIALEAAGPWPDKAVGRVLVLSGTGSCAYGRNTEGRTAKFGGRGHILGDQGSACDIALSALRAIVYQQDVKARFPALGEAVLQQLQLNHPDDLIAWTQEAEKQEIAALAMVVFSEAARQDRLAQKVLREAADKLADMAVHCAAQLVHAGEQVQFILAGGVLLKQPAFASAVRRRIHEQWRPCRVERLRRESIWGAVELAKLHATAAPSIGVAKPAQTYREEEVPSLESLAASPTELRNPKSAHLDEMPLEKVFDLMVDENVLAVKAVCQQKEAILSLIERTARALDSGGRLFYVGAGTSGRLGVLDASECPPTFRASPDQVQGIMAGGRRAIWSAVEGAEDSYTGGAAVVGFRGVRPGDVLLGIAASGRTPYVWGALREARRRGATAALLAFNPHLVAPVGQEPDYLILVDCGPEILTGSTRLKAGTATKVILNTLSTLVMLKLGKVKGNLMIDLNPSNVKLRDRAVRMLQELTGHSAAEVRTVLVDHKWMVKEALSALLEGK